jgi:spore coat polysaccharide biosynthesis protein SpsF
VVLVVVQARMNSQRLPGKVLTDLCGAPLLAWLVERVRPSRLADEILVATTTVPDDDAVEALCGELGVRCFRGHPTDVLRRFADAAEAFHPDAVVRLSADSPLLEHVAVDAVLGDFEKRGPDIAQNQREPGWPVGTAVEALSADTLRRLDAAATDERHREHVTLYAYEHPNEFTSLYVPPPDGLRAPDLRVTVDTAEDLARVRTICERFAPRRDFGLDEVISAA